MNYFVRRDVLHPENAIELEYWTKKWGVNVRQVYDAILETGSVKLSDIKIALKKNRKSGLFPYLKYKMFGVD